MPVPIPGSKVGSDTQKVKFLTISGRPKTGIFGQISGVPGPFPQFPLATNHAVRLGWGCEAEAVRLSLRFAAEAASCVVGSQRGLVKGVLTGDPPESPGGKPFTPGNPPGFHPPDLRIR